MFLNIFQNDVFASTSSKLVLNGTWMVEAYGNLGVDGTQTMTPLEKEEINGVEYNYYYRVLSRSFLYNPSPDAYAYKIVLQNNMGNEMNYNSLLVWGRPVIGTFSEVMRGDWTILDGKVLNSCEQSRDVVSTWGWYETNGSIEPLELYVGLYCKSFGDFTSGNQQTPFVDFSGEITVFLYEYTKEDYQSEISNSLDVQNEISQQQLAEAEKQTEIEEKQLEQIEEQTDTQKGILSQITDFFGGFFDNLVNSIVGIFIPDNDTMSSIWDDFQTFFSSRFGFIWQVFDYIRWLLQMLITPSDNTSITLPAFYLMNYKIWDAYVFDFNSLPIFSEIFSYVRMLTGFMISLNFINYLRDFFDKKFGGGGAQ